MNIQEWKQGIRDGIPIALGYLSVSFTFGLMAAEAGVSWWQAVIISAANLTSAGQFAGLDIMIAGGSCVEMALTQLVINLRYALMSLSLTQKLDRKFGTGSRLALGFFMTDEIFGVAASRKKRVSRSYFLGLGMLPMAGWTLGTLSGALLGGVLPPMLQSALGVAIYGMFLAIIIPQARDDVRYFKVIVMAAGLACAFHYLPGLNRISSGFAIILCSVAAAAVGAWLYPLEMDEEEG